MEGNFYRYDHPLRRSNDVFNEEQLRSSILGKVVPFASMAKCEDSLRAAIPRADSDTLHQIFNKYASVEKDGRKFMTDVDFIRRFLGLFPDENYNRESVRLLASAADTSKDGLISFEEFQAFEASLCAPDALYLTSFEIFDNNASESITADEFEKVIRYTTPVIESGFDFSCEFIKKYFGAKKNRQIGYYAFCQLLHDFYEEQGLQAFKKFDKDGDGSITAEDFRTIMTTIKGHLLTKYVRENLIAVSGGNNSSHNVRFPFYQAFNSMLSKIELFKRVFTSLARGNLDYTVTKEEFLHAVQAYAQITPYEVEIFFHLAELGHLGQRTVSLKDIENIDPDRLKRVSYITRLTEFNVVASKEERGAGTAMLESAYRFLLGSIAGACGATAVYPIDLVKTRMQNQRTGSYVGEVAYKNSFDCFKKVIRFEGFRGLYRGLAPQIVGVAPEKAIKLTVNDFIRDKLTFDGRINLISEIIAGGCAGGSQVIFTNPLEIVKIRLQVAGEISQGSKVNVFTVLKDLGFFGLYKGARACFLRDVPFSMIYFPVYAHAKKTTTDDQGINSPSSLFCSAFVAGIPAAALVTPADVIKTRLQVAARAGQTTYSGVFDCTRKIFQEEGPKAFWKGTGARVCRSSPQFAVTLLTYELLQRLFYVDFGGSRPAGSETSVPSSLADQTSHKADHVGGYKLAAATFSGIEHKFGLFLPKFESAVKR